MGEGAVDEAGEGSPALFRVGKGIGLYSGWAIAGASSGQGAAVTGSAQGVAILRETPSQAFPVDAMDGSRPGSHISDSLRTGVDAATGCDRH